MERKSIEVYNINRFVDNCIEMNIQLSNMQIEQFKRYYEILIEWNSFMNLTAIIEYEDVLKKHFLDSLMISGKVDLTGEKYVLDVGTGAGFPGIPLKIAYPELKIVLLDSLGKRVKFLDHVIEQLSLKHISAIHGRAEDYAKDAGYREKFDIVVSRAVANLSSLSEYCIPYTKPDGYFVSYKSGNIDEELQAAAKAIEILGGKVKDIHRFSLADTEERSMIVIQKVKNTPKKYPRKAGMPSREPLH